METKTDIEDVKSFVMNEGLLSNEDVEDLMEFVNKTETDNFQLAIDKFEQDIISRNLSDAEFEKYDNIASSLKITNDETPEVFDSKDHVHLHIGHPPKLSIGNFMRRIKGRSSGKLLQEFPDLQKRYYGRHFWGMGHGVWSSGNITQDMIGEYLEHHREKPNDDDNFMLEQYFSMNFSLHHIVNL